MLHRGPAYIGDKKSIAVPASFAHLKHAQPVSDILAYGVDHNDGRDYFFDYA